MSTPRVVLGSRFYLMRTGVRVSIYKGSENVMQKTLRVRVFETDEVFNVSVKCGTTAGQILQELNLQGCWIYNASNRIVYPNNFNLFLMIDDGEEAVAQRMDLDDSFMDD
jgi:hypothetical protein